MRWRETLDPSRLARVSALAILLTSCETARATDLAENERIVPKKLVREGRTRSTAARRVIWAKFDPEAPPPADQGPAPVALPENAPPVAPVAETAGAAGDAMAPKVEVTETEIHTNPPVTPGSRLALEAGRKLEGMRFQWVQVEGPPVEIADPSRASVQVTIPAGTGKLGFILVAARSDLVRLVRVSVPIQKSSTGSSASWGSQSTGKVKADAGDDQVGLVGHRVTLNGARSVPADGKTARWVQVGGPAVLAPEQQGAFFSFVPPSPGAYRFLLVVAGDGEVSEPDEVAVLVGIPPNGLATAAAAMASEAPAVPAFAPAAPRLPTPDQILAGTLPRLSDATRIGSEIADVLEAISERTTLYTSFAVLQNELVRRLDVVIPADLSQRAAWARDVFYPLTTYTASQLAASGLDLYHTQGIQQPLTPAQQERLRDHFQQMARSFRASVASR